MPPSPSWNARFPERETPVGAVTNAIHVDSWLAECAEVMLMRPYIDPVADEHPGRADWERAGDLPDPILWEWRRQGRQRLVEFARARLRRQMGRRGVQRHKAAARSDRTLDPDVLTIGFSRRFAAYKRPTLFLHDPDRLRRLLLDPQRPRQLVIAGKAHPEDDAGKALLQQVFQFAEGEDVRHRIVFLEDYDMRVTGRMVQGVDVWLNTPRRPLEASGTSGMKVLPNGGLNLSIRDGWWAEAYEEGVGWAFGTHAEGLTEEEQDSIDAAQLYETLKRDVVPLYYDCGLDDIPHGWIGMVKNSMRRLCPRFNTNGMVRQYVEEHYLPAPRQYRTLTTDGLVRAKSLSAWETAVRTHWSETGIEQASVEQTRGHLIFHARIRLGRVQPEDVAAQVYADPTDGATAEIAPMRLNARKDGAYWYEARCRRAGRPAISPSGSFPSTRMRTSRSISRWCGRSVSPSFDRSPSTFDLPPPGAAAS